MRQADRLAAVLVRGDLGDDLGGDIAGRGEGMGLLNQRAGDDGTILQHILQVDQVAVVHVLGEIVGVVEVDDAGLMGFDDLLGQQNASGDVLGDLAGHIVALDGVDCRILVGVFLLDFFVVALDEGEDLVVRGVGLADQSPGIAVGDIELGDFESAVGHDLGLDKVLNLFDGQGPPDLLGDELHAFRDAADLQWRHPGCFLGHFVGLGDGCDNFGDIEGDFRTVSFDDLHDCAFSLFES